MSAEDNKQTAKEGYEAFGRGDAEEAMANIHDDATWRVRGDNALTGTYTGKAEIGELWGKLAAAEFAIEPREFIADGDKVVVIVDGELGGEKVETADILSYDDEGKLIAFDSLGDETVPNRVYGK